MCLTITRLPTALLAVTAVIAACGGADDAALRHRIRRRWELLEFTAVRAVADDPEELADTIAKLRAGPILA